RLAETTMVNAGLNDWSRLAARHPAVAADVLGRAAAASTGFDARLLAQANAAMPNLALIEPDRALALLDALRAYVPLAQIRLETLLLYRRDAIVYRVLASEEDVQFDFGSIARKL